MSVHEPLFLLQITHTDTGAVARFPGGGALEADLVALIARSLADRGFTDWVVKGMEAASVSPEPSAPGPTPGYWARVWATITRAPLPPPNEPARMTDVVPPTTAEQVEQGMRTCVTEVLMSLKGQTKFLV